MKNCEPIWRKIKKIPHKILLCVLDIDSSMCSDGVNGDGEDYVLYDSNSGESFQMN